MKYIKKLLISNLLLTILSSCQEDYNSIENEEQNRPPMTKTIYGGSLPEVTVTALYFANGGTDGCSSGGWWYPPFTGILNPPSGSGGSGGNGGGGGGGRPNPPLPTVKLAKDLVTLFSKGCDFLKDDLEKLNSVYKEMYDDCTYKALSNLMVNDKYSGGKIMMKPAGSSLGQASVDRLGNLKFYGSDEITVENLSHEWIHMAQRCLKPEAWENDVTYLNYQGALEFDLAVFSDIIYYLKYNQIDSKNTNLPYHKSWISNLDLDDKSKIILAFVFAGWLAPNIKDRKVSEHFVDESTYKELSYYFINNTRVYKYMGLKYDQTYGLEVLNKLVNAVYVECLK